VQLHSLYINKSHDSVPASIMCTAGGTTAQDILFSNDKSITRRVFQSTFTVT
jgi:hypothetical protein